MSKRMNKIIQFVLITAGYAALLKTSSEYIGKTVYFEDFSKYYVSYLLIYGFSVFSLICKHSKEDEKGRFRGLRITFSALFAIMFVLPNYALWWLPTPEYAGRLFVLGYHVLYVFTVLAGTFTGFLNIFEYIENLDQYLWKPVNTEKSAVWVFVSALCLISMVYISILIFCKYPGNVVTDSFAQIYQVTGDSPYSNHHPVYHTIVIGMFMKLGFALFGNINAAIATYHFFQIIFMAVCFSYSVMTLYEMKAPRWIILLVTIGYAFLPYHIMYSFTMTKDVMFGGFALVMIVSVGRYLRGIGNACFNIGVFAVSSLGVCLFRSNGLIAYVLWAFLALILLRKEKRVLIIMLIVIVLGFIMKKPVLNYIGIRQTDMIESLSIPLQQIGRTLRDCDDFETEELELISKVVDPKDLGEKYWPDSSDPIKEFIREAGNEAELVDNKWVYFKLYLEIGLRHPFEYLVAWVDETSGFWNAGYSKFPWLDFVDPGIYDNRYNVERVVRIPLLNQIVNEALWLFEQFPILQLFLCLGLYTWIYIILLYISIIRRDKSMIMSVAFFLAVIITLLIANPVNKELRYVYAGLCMIPYGLVLVLKNDQKTVLNDMEV